MLEVKIRKVAGEDIAINCIKNSYTVGEIDTSVPISDKSLAVAKSLGTNTESHQSHDAYLKGIEVWMDIKYPLYWSPEFQRYHFAEILMSQSTMHSLDKFLNEDFDPFNKYVTEESKILVKKLYDDWKLAKEKLSTYMNNSSGLVNNDEVEELKENVYTSFMKLRSNIPSGLELWETVKVNYLQLKTIWVQRHNHKLKEDWVDGFCKVIEDLPYFKELVIGKYLNTK